MQKIEKKFMQAAKNLKAWACVDSEAGVVGVFETREEARSSKRYAESHGHKQKVAKLVFEEFVR
jgi:hypothetical protein